MFRNVSRRRGKQRGTGIDCRMKQVRSGTRKCERQQREREVARAKEHAYEELYDELETEAGQKELYRLAKQRKRAGKDVQLVKVIKDENGVLLSSEEDVRQRWKNYFEKLMNEENERERRENGGETVSSHVRRITKDAVKAAMRRMKRGKAVGPDDIPIEAWKALGDIGVNFLTKLFNQLLETEEMPEEWRKSKMYSSTNQQK